MAQTDALKDYQQVAESFIARNPKSKAIYEKATESLPGGNTRSSVYYDPFPLAIQRAEGSRLYDEDGHEYIDMLNEYTAGLYGHSEPIIRKEITKALQKGMNYGSQHENEAKLAALIKDRFSGSIDLLRFTNSGTEATLMALAVAKAYTNRKKIMVFSGSYHGGAFIFKDGKSGPINAPHEYLFASYNDIASVKAVFEDPENASDVAAIIMEGMIGASGAIPADIEFLKDLREIATRYRTVLIFDEVMTSRMYDGGGIQSQLPSNMRPDMTTLGKYIGGGMSFGAFGGKRSIMELFDPRKPTAMMHAGTFNNNVLTMAAGRAGLEQIFTSERARELHSTGDKLRASLQLASSGTLMKVTGLGSMMCFHFTKTKLEDIHRPEDLADEDSTLLGLLHLSLMEKGYYIARRGFLALSLVLNEADLKGFVDVVKEFLQTYKSLVSIGKANGMVNGH